MTNDARAALLEMAHNEGFDLARIAPATVLTQARSAALDAHNDGFLDGMSWITDEWLERSSDPNAFLEGARSVLLVALSYGQPQPARSLHGPSRGRVAAYAQGRDYHRIFETKLRRISRRIRDELQAGARPTVDYGPLLERPLAALAGLGWQGKSTMLLVPGFGPWVLLGAVATTLDVPPDIPLKKTCGSCRRCIVACPTGALSGNGGVVDARRCISYQTIENRGPIPRSLRPQFGDWIFGCDACLDACPVAPPGHNPHSELLPASPDDAMPPLAELLALSEDAFRERFRGRPIIRAKRDGFLRNVCVAVGNVGTADDLPALSNALWDISALVRGHAAWATGQLGIRRMVPAQRCSELLEKRLGCEHDPFVREELDAALRTLATEIPCDHRR